MSIEDIVIEKLSTEEIYSRSTRNGEYNTTEEALVSEVNDYILMMEANENNFAFRPIVSQKKWYGSIAVFVKRVIRKFLKWYIEPICFQQTDFNNASVSAVMRISSVLDILNQKTEKLNKEHEQYEKLEKEKEEQLRRLESENSELRKRIEIMEAVLKMEEHNTDVI